MILAKKNLIDQIYLIKTFLNFMNVKLSLDSSKYTYWAMYNYLDNHCSKLVNDLKNYQMMGDILREAEEIYKVTTHQQRFVHYRGFERFYEFFYNIYYAQW